MELEARKSIVGYSLEESDFLPHAWTLLSLNT
jgi:hypothetical protein